MPRESSLRLRRARGGRYALPWCRVLRERVSCNHPEVCVVVWSPQAIPTSVYGLCALVKADVREHAPVVLAILETPASTLGRESAQHLCGHAGGDDVSRIGILFQRAIHFQFVAV